MGTGEVSGNLHIFLLFHQLSKAFTRKNMVEFISEIITLSKICQIFIIISLFILRYQNMSIVTWIQLIYENFSNLVMIFLRIMAQLLTGFTIDFGPNEKMNTDSMNFCFASLRNCPSASRLCNSSIFTYVTLLLCNN